jgi:NADH:ubiquinone oxidoreductase subunit K
MTLSIATFTLSFILFFSGAVGFVFNRNLISKILMSGFMTQAALLNFVSSGTASESETGVILTIFIVLLMSAGFLTGFAAILSTKSSDHNDVVSNDGSVC